MAMVPLCILLHICVAVYPPGGGGGGGGNLGGIGVNYGRVADNLPEPSRAVAMIKSLGVAAVKLFDANPQVLMALANSSLPVTIMVPNEEIGAVSASGGGENWVRANVDPYYPATRIIVIVVGNEIFSYPALAQAWMQLLPAMNNLRSALASRRLDGSIKVTTSVAADVLGKSFPPSDGQFRSDIKDSVMKPLLRFLQDTNSPFYINLYPYFAWKDNQPNITLDYALFGSKEPVVKDGKLQYTNLLDAMIDASFAAMEDVGYGGVTLGISETGWPSDGGPGASVANAATYNRRLVRKMSSSPGTPRRPHATIPTFIFALFNENLKPGAATEQHWGLLYPDGRPVYQIDLSGKTDYAPISVAVSTSSSVNPTPPSSVARTWCVANQGVGADRLQAQLDAACGQSDVGCTATQQGGLCYLPNTVAAHASFVFNARWRVNGGCDFGGTATLTDVDPSYGSCVFA